MSSTHPPGKPGLLPEAARKLLFGSIRVKLIALVVISVLPSLGVITYSGLKLERQAVENAAGDALTLVRDLAATHQQTVEGTRQLLMTLSKLPEVRQKDVPACNRLLAELRSQNRAYANILVADERGLVYASALPPGLRKDISHRRYFQEAARSHDFSPGEYVIGMVVNRPVLHFAYPLLGAAGAFEGVVIAAVDLSRYRELFQAARLPPGSSMDMSDYKGIRLFGCGPEKPRGEAHEPAGIERMSAGPPEGTFAAATGGEKKLFAYTRFHLAEGKAPYLFMEVSISEKQALAGAKKVLGTNLALLGLAFFVALASAVFLGNGVIVSRLARLVATSRELGKGDFRARTGLTHGPDELGLLAGAFDEMAQELERKESDRVRAEEALRQSRAHLAEAMDLARIVYWEADPETGEYLFNDPFYAFFGTSAGREGGYKMSREEYARRFVHPDDLPAYLEGLDAYAARGDHEFPYDIEHRIVRRDGQVRHITARRRRIRNEAGQTVRRYGANQDITERKRAEEELRAQETRFRMIFEDSPTGMAMAGADYRFVRANRAFCRMLGFTQAELASLTFREITHPAHIAEDVPAIADVFSGKAPLYRTEKRYIRKDGEFVWGSSTISAVRDKDGRFLHFLSMIEDITQRKQAEEEKAALQSQLLHAQKMEAVGQLAGGVAHDFNNILMALMGYGNLLQMKMEPNDPLRVYVDHILAATGKAANLTQSLLTFGRKQVVELKPCKVAALVKEAEKLLRRLLPEDIELRIDVGADLTVMADVVQIDQVLMNLATNARDAMPRGGRLTIEAAAAVIDREFKRNNGFGAAGQYALICVTDTGLGMDEKTKEKVFEPFFTTKEVGKGTGLGLAIVYGIVKQHSGYITIESTPGAGTTFRIYLPVVQTRVLEATKLPSDPPGGCETILFAEDNPDIRRMAADILGMAGYEVIEAADGADAVEKFMARRDSVQLLVLDVVMPVKGGKEAFDAIKAVKRDVRALFVSGYTGDVILDKGLAGGAIDFLAKPVTPEGLLTKVRQVLDRQPA